jgi:hypothetical protein
MGSALSHKPRIARFNEVNNRLGSSNDGPHGRCAMVDVR